MKNIYIEKTMTLEYAKKISAWQYQPPYQIYSFNKSDELIDELLGGEYCAIILDKKLVGYYCMGKSAQIPTKASIPIYSDDTYIDIGLGMEPSLTNKGNGNVFFKFIVQCVKSKHTNKNIRLSVASFNKRAITLYSHHGFVEHGVFTNKSSSLDFIVMLLKLYDN